MKEEINSKIQTKKDNLFKRMKRYFKFKYYIADIDLQYCKSLKRNRDIIIESFVEHYGEEYRNLIIERYNMIVFNWSFQKDFYTKNGYFKNYEKKCIHFDSFVCDSLNISNPTPKQLKMLFAEDMKFTPDINNNKIIKFLELDKESQLDYLKEFYNEDDITKEVLNKVVLCVSNIKKSCEKALHYKKAVYPLYELYEYNDLIDYDTITSTNVYKENFKIKIKSNILNKLKNAYCLTCFPSNKKFDIYFFLGIATDDTLLHEIDHAISTIYFFQDGKKYFCKSGFSVPFDTKTGFNEAYTEYSIQKIKKIFDRRGGRIFGDYNELINIKSVYTHLFPLIDPIYSKYKKILDKAKLTDNKNIIFKYLDKTTFEEYERFLNQKLLEIYKLQETKEFFNEINSITQTDIDYVNELVNKMAITPKEEMTLEEYQKLYPDVHLRKIK